MATKIELTKEQKEASNNAIQIALDKEAQLKGKSVLKQLAEDKGYFIIHSFEEKEQEIGGSIAKWISFNYTANEDDCILNASIMLFRKNIYSDKECKVLIPNVKSKLLGTVAAKQAFENQQKIKPVITKGFIKVYSQNEADPNKQDVSIVESEEITFEIIEEKKK